MHDHVIQPPDFIPDAKAFLDVRLERSKGKLSYSFIGPGVSQNASQQVNVTVEHGFHVGGAAMPHGVVNNPHLHYTAEVFLCTRGNFRFEVGEHGGHAIEIDSGTIFSVPTWAFRGFENTGPDDGWLFTVLGGNDTGGILWAPHVVAEAATTGMYLGEELQLLDAESGDDISDALQPMESAALACQIVEPTASELADRAIRREHLGWSTNALLSSVLPEHDSSLAPVIGHGMTQDRRQSSPITNPHGFSVDWLRVEAGSSTGMHRHNDSQAMFLVDGDWLIEMELDGQRQSTRPMAGSIVSVPMGVWRTFRNIGSRPAVAVVVCGSDAPTRLEWAPELVASARRAGWALDAAGYIAPDWLIRGGS